MACVTPGGPLVDRLLKVKSIGFGGTCSIYIANTYPLAFPRGLIYLTGGRGVGGPLRALCLKFTFGESKFWLFMLWLAFRIKPATEGSLHCTFSYDLHCSSLAQVSILATYVPCGWKLLNDNTQQMCCTLGFNVPL